jgi:hypothetical protein
VTVAVTSALFGEMAIPICLSTVIVAALFVRLAGRMTSPSALLIYCLIGGVAAGWLNAVLGCVSVVIFAGEAKMLWVVLFPILLGLFAALWGIPYGVSYFAPLWLEQKYRKDRLLEARERVMFLSGTWGILTLLFVRWLTTATEITFHRLGPLDGLSPPTLARILWLVAFLASLGVMGLGALRLAALRLWISRVRKRRVPGWLVCPAEEFASHVVERLPHLSAPWWSRRRRPGSLEVMARGSRTSADRNQPLEPVYRVR